MEADLLRSRDAGEGLGALFGARQRWHRALDARFYPANVITERIGLGLSELMALEQHWRALAATQSPSRFMHAYEWQLAYLRHLAATPETVCYVSFFASGRPIAIFPLSRVRRSVGRISLWLWASPMHPHLVLCEPLISPEWAGPELFRRLVGVLERFDPRPWDALHLPNLLEDGVATRLLMADRVRGLHLEKTGCSMHFRCTDMATALASCSTQFKRNLRRQGKRLAEHGEVSLCIARDGDELEAAFADFLHLEASGWKGESGRNSAIALHSRLFGFYSDLKDGFARRQGCIISLLKLDGQAIAAQFALLAGGTLYIQKIAYDEAWHAEAPGSQLMLKMIEHCCADPMIANLSLVTGPLWAVGRWNPHETGVWEAYVFRPTLRGAASLVMRRFKTGVWMPLQAWLARTRSRMQAAGGNTT